MTDELLADAMLNALLAHNVTFVLIGGLAVAAHGAIRGTKDVDVVPDPAPANLARLGEALAAIGARVDLRDLGPDELGIAPDADGLALGGNWVLLTDLGRLDVLQEVAGVSGYASLRRGAAAFHIPGVSGPVLVAGFDDVIAMKAAAGRQQDLSDIDALRRARGEVD